MTCRTQAPRLFKLVYLFLVFVHHISPSTALAQRQATQSKSLNQPGTTSQKRVKREQKVGSAKTKVVKDEVRKTEGHQAGTGIAVFMGVTAGPFSLSSGDPDLESNKSGYFLAGKALCSIYSENFVTDVGLGWFYGEVDSPGPGVAEIPPQQAGVQYTPGPVSIALNAGLFEVAPRYRLTENWQIGPMLNVFFSSDDTSFSGRYEDLQNPSQVSAMIGAQLMYGVPKKQADWRAGLEFMTDVSVADRQLQVIALTLQFGLPLVSPDTIYQERELLTERERLELVEKQRIDRKVVVKEIIKFVFEKQQIMFINGGNVLHIDSQSFLLQLSGILQANRDSFHSITVESHVGPDAPPGQAKPLSESRAKAVMAALIAAGLDASKVRSVGFGSSSPMRPGLPSDSDERIVLSFSGIKDLRPLSAAVHAIREEFQFPETCSEDGGCR